MITEKEYYCRPCNVDVLLRLYCELDIVDAQDELLCLCVALAIDCITADAAAGATASTAH